MVTPEAPVNAVKNAHATRDTIGQTGRHPAEQGAGQAYQSLRCIAFTEQVAGECEQGYRQQNRHFCNTVKLDGHCLQINVGLVKIPECTRRDDGEQRRTQQNQQQ